MNCGATHETNGIAFLEHSWEMAATTKFGPIAGFLKRERGPCSHAWLLVHVNEIGWRGYMCGVGGGSRYYSKCMRIESIPGINAYLASRQKSNPQFATTLFDEFSAKPDIDDQDFFNELTNDAYDAANGNNVLRGRK